ncbi:spore coat protein [Ammoniphilus sp. CFH 90114]|uniref:spore coat protein n=1 Tax=Ammoniphilus sp. CFH 90114 TaxID=2493665 RepID=UPI00100F0C33|nr:spore coat protein [Ammoniphilus sp. CFH 90114]RXT15352.1 spore coat protein [Ammoniphilus sp. CFH 90114]
MTAQYGAHEVMEMHEVLTDAIDGINQFQLYRPHATDQQLVQMIDRHLQFMLSEYNLMVQTLNQKGMNQAVPYRAPRNVSPTYGLDNPSTQAPNMSIQNMDDRDVASGMLGCYKASAVFKMNAALECADPQLRRTLQQGAVNCSEMAYEVWQYMNEKGYYQIPTMKEMTTNTMINTYTQGGPMNQMGQMNPMIQMPAGQHSVHQGMNPNDPYNMSTMRNMVL